MLRTTKNPHKNPGLVPKAVTTCPADGMQACPAPLPFCCPIDSACISLVSDNSTVLCCPFGSNCGTLGPIYCDVSRQNETLYPAGLLHTTKFNTILPSCGNLCCPLTFSCVNGTCVSHGPVSNTTQTSIPVAATSARISSSSMLGLSSSTATTPTLSPSASAVPSDDSSSKTPVGTIVGGLIGGLVLAVAITFLVLWLLRRRRERKRLAEKTEHDAPAYNRPATCVSDPIAATPFGSAHRTDFSHWPGPSTGNTTASSNRLSTPVFPSPLRYGSPGPSPTPPKRPQRTDEYLSTGARNPSTYSTVGPISADGRPMRELDSVKEEGMKRHNTDASSDSRNHSERVVSSETIDILMEPPGLRNARNPNVLSSATTWGQFLKLSE